MNNEIYIGSLDNPDFIFMNDTLFSIDGYSAVDLVGQELSIDELKPRVFHVFYDFQPVTFADYDYIESSDGYVMCSNGQPKDLRSLEYGTPIWWFTDGSLQMKMYIRNVERLSRDEYRINAMSAIGLADAQYHNGGIYQGVRADVVINEIVDGLFPYTVDEEVAKTLVYGYLPIATKRENLHQLMLAENICLTKDDNGDVIFSYLYDVAPVDINSEEIFIGGTVDYSAPASKVQVTEHAYQKLTSIADVLLFDNTSEAAVVDKFVPFESPVIIDSSQPDFGLTVTGSITITNAQVNYCIVSGIGTISGKPYTHVTQVIEKVSNSSTTEKVITLTNATLISAANSENVAERLLDYYSERKVVRSGIVQGDRTCGRKVKFTNPYGEEQEGYISKMDIVASSFVKADTEIITNYVPKGQGNAFTKSIRLIGSGRWNIPEEIYQKATPTIKVVLIGGGQGGQGSFPGKDGGRQDGGGYFPEGGEGGNGGQGGLGGKIYMFTIDLSGQQYFDFDCGVGGIGGDPEQLGALGTATTFGTYSSDSGSVVPLGYVNIFDGMVYGANGLNGIKGGKGGKPGKPHTTGVTTEGYLAESVTYNGQTWEGGETEVQARQYEPNARQFFQGAGGGGGGATVGARGGDYQFATLSAYNGGNGADSIAQPKQTTYGSGGNGSHGAGGGGSAGVLGLKEYNPSTQSWGNYTWFDYTYRSGGHYLLIEGKGGQAAKGGDGGDGCIIVIW